jgi:tetratricopeptide (TPR) repeat protein
MRKEPIHKAQIWLEELQQAVIPEERELIIKKLKNYTTLYPDDYYAKFVLALAYYHSEEYSKALQLLNELIEVTHNMHIISLRADVLNSMGRTFEALKFLKEMELILSGIERKEAQFQQILYLLNLGLYEDALNLYEQLGGEKELINVGTNFITADKESIATVINLMESYKKGKEWAEAHKGILEKVNQVFKKYFKIKTIIPFIEEDWEMGDRPWIRIYPAEVMVDPKDWFEKESEAAKEIYKEFPNEVFVIEVVPFGEGKIVCAY